MSKTIAQLNPADMPLSRREFIELSQLAASKKAMLCQMSGRVELLAYLPDGFVKDGSVNYASQLNSAIEAAQAGVRVLVLPEFPVRIDTQIAYSGTLNVIGSHGPTFAQEEASELIWGGAPGIMVKLTGTNRGGWSGVTLNGAGIATTCMKLDGCQRGDYVDVNYTGFTSGTGLHLTGEYAVCSWNDFHRIQVNATGYTGFGTGHSCIWIGRTSGTPGAGNACHNRFYGPEVQHGGTRHAWYLGNGDNNTIYSPFVFRQPGGTGKGFYIDPTEGANMPVGYNFYHMQAGDGGYVHGAATEISPGTIWGYQTDNGQPTPVLTGVPTFVHMFGGPRFTDVALANNWVAYTAGMAPRWCKDPYKWVDVEGYIKDGTATNGTYVGTMPDGARPPADRVFAVAAGATTTLLTVKGDTGRITISAEGAAGPISLSGIRYKAA